MTLDRSPLPPLPATAPGAAAPEDQELWINIVAELKETERQFLERLRAIDKFFVGPLQDGQFGDWLKVNSLAVRLIFGTKLKELIAAVEKCVDRMAQLSESPTNLEVIDCYDSYLT